MITLVLDCIDRLNVYNTAAHFSEYAGEEAAESWKEIVNLLYELLGTFSCLYNYMCVSYEFKTHSDPHLNFFKSASSSLLILIMLFWCNPTPSTPPSCRELGAGSF